MQVVRFNYGYTIYLSTLATLGSNSKEDIALTVATIVGSTGKGPAIDFGTVKYQTQNNQTFIIVSYRILEVDLLTRQSTNSLATNNIIYVNNVSPRSVYRAGSNLLRDMTTNMVKGTSYWQIYSDIESNSGIGIGASVLNNQIFFNYCYLQYVNISSPFSQLVTQEIIVMGGQQYARYLNYGIGQVLSYPGSVNFTNTLFYTESLPLFPKSLSVLFVNRTTYVIDFMFFRPQKR